MKVVNNVKAIRAQSGLSQTEFGKRIGLSKNSISSFERQEFQPTAETIITISLIFGVSLDQIIFPASD